MKALVLLLFLLSLINIVSAQRVMKVKGSKVYFKKSGYSVKVGEELIVLSSGTDAASIEVLKTKKNIAVGKIVNGTVKVGYQVQLRRKAKRSRHQKRKNKNYRTEMTIYGGLGFYLLGELEFEDDSKFDFNNHMVLPIGFEFFFSPKLSGSLGLVYAFSGGGNPTNLTGTDEWDTSYIEFNGDLIYYFNEQFYGRGGFGYTIMNLSGTNEGDSNSALNGNFDFDISGFNFGLGGGIIVKFQKTMDLKIDLGYRYASLNSASLSYPTTTDKGNPNLNQSNINLSVLLSLKI